MGTEQRAAVVAGAVAVLVVAQAVTSRHGLTGLPGPLWLVPAWAVWVALTALAVLHPRPLVLAAAAVAGLHGAEHLGLAGGLGPVHLLVEVLLLALLLPVPGALLAAHRDRQRRQDLRAYLREPLPASGPRYRREVSARASGSPGRSRR